MNLIIKLANKLIVIRVVIINIIMTINIIIIVLPAGTKSFYFISVCYFIMTNNFLVFQT